MTDVPFAAVSGIAAARGLIHVQKLAPRKSETGPLSVAGASGAA
jgi:hypothetical protein